MQSGWIAAAVLALSACGRNTPPAATNAIPADSTAAAVIELAALRNAPAYPELPLVNAYAQMPETVKQVAIAWNGRDLLLIAAGSFAQPPQGYTTIGKGIAAAGPAARVE